jgi:hypothetical protein
MRKKESLRDQLIEMRSKTKSLCTILQRSWKRRVNTANIDSLHQLYVIVNKSLWHLWNACNYTSVFHSNIWQKCLKTLKQQTLEINFCVILKTFGHDCTPSTTPVHWTGQTWWTASRLLGTHRWCPPELAGPDGEGHLLRALDLFLWRYQGLVQRLGQVVALDCYSKYSRSHQYAMPSK